LDEDHAVDMAEFAKLLRTFNMQAVNTIRAAFQAKDTDKDGDLSALDTRRVLLSLGFCKPAGAVSTSDIGNCEGCEGATSTPDMGLWEFVELVEACRLENRQKMRKNQGFTQPEIRRLHHQFKNHDLDGNGVIKNKQLTDLIDSLFPKARLDFAVHEQAKVLLEAGDADADGAIDFDDFARMMRILQDEAYVEKLLEEQAAWKESGYTRSEVGEFRKVFQMFDDDSSGEISHNEVEIMFEGILPLDRKSLGQLHYALSALDGDGDRSLTFGEFLRLMRRLQDANWNDINTTSAEVARASLAEQEEDQNVA